MPICCNDFTHSIQDYDINIILLCGIKIAEYQIKM